MKGIYTKIIYAVIIGAAVVLFIVSRPTGESAPKEKETAKKDALAETMKKEEIKEAEQPKKETPSELKIAPAEVEKRISQHGKTPVLERSPHEKLIFKPLNLPKAEPNWENPTPLAFEGLKKLYMYYRLKNSVPKEVGETLNGAAVSITGALMPIDVPAEDGLMKRFWLANPVVVMAGCVFCTPPTLGDLIFVEIPAGQSFKVDREKLYSEVFMITIHGQLFIQPNKTNDKVEYFYKINYTDSSNMR